jgi:hypothetical protein
MTGILIYALSKENNMFVEESPGYKLKYKPIKDWKYYSYPFCA